MKMKALVVGLLISAFLFAADTGAELFQKAVTQERAAGNLEEAIKLYQRVATEFASDRALVAKALVAEARCYEKLGQDKALKLYEQVTHDYKDQRDLAAAANSRLVALRLGQHPATPATMTQREIELPESGEVPLAFEVTDGQRAVFRDSTRSGLVMSDIAGSNKRVILKPGSRQINAFVVSRDFSFVVMVLEKSDSKHWAMVRTDGTGFRQIGGDWTGARPCDPEVSWDNRYVLFCRRQAAGPPQLVRFSMADGETRDIHEADGNTYRFSPDGRFIAYNSAGRIYVMPSLGGEPQLAGDRGSVLEDWTRDGRYLIVREPSGSAVALTLLPIIDGRPAGAHVFVRYGDFTHGRTTIGGGFIYEATAQSGGVTAWIGSLDSTDGSLGWKRLNLTGSNSNPYFPTWSPDSTQIEYVSYDAAAGQYSASLRLRTIATGDDRELYRTNVPAHCLWMAQKAAVFCMQYGATNTAFSISADTGRVESMGDIPAGLQATPILLTDDDRTVYLASTKLGLVRWQIGSAQWSTVVENPNGAPSTYYSAVSPDCRWVTRWENEYIEIRPIAGGDWRPLAPAPNRRFAAFTPNGNWFVYPGPDAAGKKGLFRVATSGGQPERLGDFPTKAPFGYIWISPDGKKIIGEASNLGELWMLENFEPKQQAAK